jgi:outer membrane receptor protein involved in Fe transport
MFHGKARLALATTTSVHAHVTKSAGYVQQGVDLLARRLHFDAVLRFDDFRFDVNDYLDTTHSGARGASRFQPKANISYTPFVHVPLTLDGRYGRGISSEGARGMVQQPTALQEKRAKDRGSREIGWLCIHC